MKGEGCLLICEDGQRERARVQNERGQAGLKGKKEVEGGKESD